MLTFSTGKLAELGGVAPRTATGWIDSNEVDLRGFRVPDSQDRRVPEGEVLRFFERYQLPPGALCALKGNNRVLMLTGNPALADALQDELEDAQVHWTSCSYSAGADLQEYAPRVLVIDTDIFSKQPADADRSTTAKLDSSVAAFRDRFEFSAIVILKSSDENVPAGRGVAVLEKPCGPEEVAHVINAFEATWFNRLVTASG